MPLRIAAKVPRSESGYFKERLEPEIDGDRVRLVGEVNDEKKEQFLGGRPYMIGENTYISQRCIASYASRPPWTFTSSRKNRKTDRFSKSLGYPSLFV